MANQPPPRRRVRRKSFTAQFALVLVAVGLATAVVAGVVAWVETQQARAQQETQAGLGASRLAGTLVRMQTATASQRFACEVAALPTTAKAYAVGPSSLATIAKAAVANASPDQVLIFLGSSGQLLAQAPAGAVTLPKLGSTAGASNCADPGKVGFYFAASARHLVGVGVAAVGGSGTSPGRVVVLTPVTADVLSYAQQLVDTAGLHSSTALMVGGKLALPARVGPTTYQAGATLPGSLLSVLGGERRVGQASVDGTQFAVSEQPLHGENGLAVADLLVLESGGGISVTLADLALPLALAVAGVLLLGMVVVFLLVEHFLNRPLRRLDIAVQRLGLDAYAAPVNIEGGAEEITRLAANFELVRKQLRRQLLIATGRTVIASTLTGSAPLDQALDQVLRSLVDLLGADIAMILLRPQAQMPRGFVLSTGVAEPALTWADLEGTDGIIGSLIRQPRFLARTHLSPEERGTPEEQMGLKDCLAEPMRSEDHDLGLLLVGNKRKPYIDEDYTLCRGVADQIVVAVDKSTRLAVTQREATTDEMTGLYNYRFLVGYLDQQVNVAERASSPLSVLMLDLDHFKAVNDSHGHPAGDRLLRQFAGLMVETIRKSDLAARYGGEEFVVVMANTARGDAEVVADKIRSAVEEMTVRLDDGTEVQITVSIGGVTFPEGSKGARNLLDLADRALYAAKRNGRNRVEFLDLAATAGEPVST
ncbi:MAG TPA: sensor domain-containing diguanylate cyclase [Candidatus Dormibacteraeota bacterium]|nr:sensor domain-containing diguanylate cyclase [Candidatus Dormibacteraeota bacterium]